MTGLPQRPLGRTGMMVTEVIFGGIPILQQSTAEAVGLLQYAYDQGISTFDTARGYGDSEVKMGLALAGRKCFLNSKSPTRDADGIVADVEAALQRVRRDHFDVYQMHQIGSAADAEAVLAPGGALEGLQRARAQGRIRFIGASGHNRRALVRLIEQAGDQVDSVMFLFNPLETDALDRLVPLCAERQVGLIAMKAPGGGVFTREQTAASTKWVLSHSEVSCATIGFACREDVDEAVRVVREGPELSPAEQEVVRGIWDRFERDYCRRCAECHPCPQGINIVGLMVGVSMVQRLGWEQLGKRDFLASVERVSACDGCGVCVERCAWDLDIPRLIAVAAEEIRALP